MLVVLYLQTKRNNLTVTKYSSPRYPQVLARRSSTADEVNYAAYTFLALHSPALRHPRMFLSRIQFYRVFMLSPACRGSVFRQAHVVAPTRAYRAHRKTWIPACAGMTDQGPTGCTRLLFFSEWGSRREKDVYNEML